MTGTYKPVIFISERGVKVNTNKIIQVSTSLLVAFLAASAFVLSYDALHKLALANGITPSLAWLWPLTLDAVMIAASLIVLSRAMSGERARYALALVAMFTLLSIGFNVLHASVIPASLQVWIARAVFALPPIVVFIAFELLASQVLVAYRRNSKMQSLAELDKAIARARQDLADLESQADAIELQKPASVEVQGIAEVELQQPAKVQTAKRSDYTEFAAMQSNRNGQGSMSVPEIMQTFNVSQRTAYNWLAKFASEPIAN